MNIYCVEYIRYIKLIDDTLHISFVVGIPVAYRRWYLYCGGVLTEGVNINESYGTA